MSYVCPEQAHPWELSHLQRLYDLIRKQSLQLRSILGQPQFPKDALDFFQQRNVEPSRAVLPGVLIYHGSIAQLDNRQVGLGGFPVNSVLHGQLACLARMDERPIESRVCTPSGRLREAHGASYKT